MGSTIYSATMGIVVLLALEALNEIVEEQKAKGDDLEDADPSDVAFDMVQKMKEKVDKW
jgi:hypothetical protein